tara:strand:+ start:10690 stop:11484 length:795 start_codon:yes stop_codon:yes gene_type:complete
MISKVLYPNTLNSYDVVIHANEIRYWIFMIGSILVGFLVVRMFAYLDEKSRDAALRKAGVILIIANLVMPIYGFINPNHDMSWHRNLPLHLCGVNYALVGLNCFFKNKNLFMFSAFTGTIGGVHALLTPQLTIGDAPLVLFDYYFKHTSIVIMPIIMAQSFGFRFPKWGWIWTYASVAVLTTFVGVFNWGLNTFYPGAVSANYMYMWEAPKVDNPFVWDLSWPWYILPLHGALILHLLLINALYRWGTSAQGSANSSWLRRHFT